MKNENDQDNGIHGDDLRTEESKAPDQKPETVPDDELDQVTGGLNTNWHFDW